MEAIFVLRVTTSEPLNATAVAVTSPVNEKFLLAASTVAVEALPVTAPVNPVDVNIPVDGLYVNPVSVSAAWEPVAPSTKTGKWVEFSEFCADTLKSGAVLDTVPNVRPPLPSVFKYCPSDPSAAGRTQILLADKAGASNPT